MILYLISNHSCILHIHHIYRVLRSFPTRRSSDLVEDASRSEDDARDRDRDTVSGVLQIAHQADEGVEDHRRRSEEHTSELQSRGQLVCRLLLEKKKDVDTCNEDDQEQNEQYIHNA